MMQTPICDFVRRYVERGALRLHMPGHKGQPFLGPEPLDITEIDGADSLYEADGIIGESEANASALFGCRTVYSTEGSSQCIRAMVHLALQWGREQGKQPLIAAGRNAHKTFLSAAALLDAEVEWLVPAEADSYLSCRIDPAALEQILREKAPAAVYVTSPDYLGQLTDIAELAALCHRYGTLLLVDNAHGAYLRFLPESLHPMDLGADLCCDSAHKTFPVLTGGAYLHMADRIEVGQAKIAMSLFGSTSPSYLILQSLDRANRYLQDYPKALAAFLPQLQAMKQRLIAHGYELREQEPLKLTVSTKPYGYRGCEYAALLQRRGVVCEFADADFVVMMLTPETGTAGLQSVETVMLAIQRRPSIAENPPVFRMQQRVMSIRQAMLSPSETVPVRESVGRVLAAASVGCPPAVPILVSGEMIDETAVNCFVYYGIETCTVVKTNGNSEG